ncbi:MAG: hypothetical protein GY751_01445 [Bacteroidetes bacterium]|nr:hypothetical protein [Bacteroidota bacterium]
MDKIGEIEIKVIGKSGNQELKPDNYDIKYLASLLQNIEDLLYPNNKKERPLITYDIQEGSVKHIFKTTIQSIIGFSAILTQVNSYESIDFLELRTARAIENIQNVAVQKDYEFQIKTSRSRDFELIISPSTHFYRAESIWVDAEFYFYGILKDAGGKSKANIHLDTSEFGYLTIETGKEFLEEREENLLYKNFGVRAIGKQNSETGEVDTKTLKLIELINYESKYDDDYLNKKISQAKQNWRGIDPDDWLFKLRGDYDA